MAVAALALLLGVLFWEHRHSNARWTNLWVGDPHVGATLFFEKKGCAHCHPVNGYGGKSAPDLGYASSPQSSLSQLVSAMWNCAPRMWERMRAEKLKFPDAHSGGNGPHLRFSVHRQVPRRVRRQSAGPPVAQDQGVHPLPCRGRNRRRSRTGPGLGRRGGHAHRVDPGDVEPRPHHGGADAGKRARVAKIRRTRYERSAGLHSRGLARAPARNGFAAGQPESRLEAVSKQVLHRLSRRQRQGRTHRTGAGPQSPAPADRRPVRRLDVEPFTGNVESPVK